MDTAPTRILTIGCSCLNRFQFDFFQDRHPDASPLFVKSLFDWNIISLVGTDSLLQLAVDGSLRDALEDRSQYRVEWDVLLFHAQMPGVCFYHEQETAQRFGEPAQQDALISKLIHQAAPFLAPDTAGRTHLIWSNGQPNLPDTVENVTPWEHFQLTVPRYTAITTLARRLFGARTTFSFLAHPADIDPALTHKPDVHLLSLDRGPDYQGPTDLYETLLTNIVRGTHR